VPKVAKELGALAISRLTAEGIHAVGGVPGLHLQIRGNSKSWVLRIKVGAKRRDMGLGSYPGVTLSTARENARRARQSVDNGSDPILERAKTRSELLAKQSSLLPFSDATQKFIAAKSSEWRNAKHLQQWANTLATYALPVIGKMHVGDVRTDHILKILEPIWNTKTETATRVRSRIEQVLDWSIARKYREGDNPARWRGHLDKLLPRPTKIAKVGHHEALPLDEMPSFMTKLTQLPGTGAKALEFLILTAARSGEVRGALWSEIARDRAEWVVPAERMKAGKEHRLPLSKAAIELLENLPRNSESDLIFPSKTNRPQSDMTLTATMRRMGLSATPHGFRSTFRDWASERTSHSREAAEMALAHVIPNKVEAAYRRGDLMEKRRALMEDWSRFCLGSKER
jgi:integrase